MALPKLTETRSCRSWRRSGIEARPRSERFKRLTRPRTNLRITTVQTMVYRLEAKKAIRRVKKIGNAHIFEAMISRSAAQRRLVDELLSFFGGRYAAGRRAPDRVGPVDAGGRPGGGADAPEAVEREKGQVVMMSRLLVDHLWQSTVCVALAGLLVLMLRKNRPHGALLIWLSASLKFLVPFGALSAIGRSGDLAAGRDCDATPGDDGHRHDEPRPSRGLNCRWRPPCQQPEVASPGWCLRPSQQSGSGAS